MNVRSLLTPGVATFLLAVTFACRGAAFAATIPVISADDDVLVNGNCTLREAVIAANTDSPIDACPAGNGADVVELPAGGYWLDYGGAGEDSAWTGDLDLLDDVTISGTDAFSTIIHGNFDRVFDVHAEIAVAFEGLTIEYGNVSGSGAGIRALDADVVVERCRLDHNWASHDGGGIAASGGTLAVRDTWITGSLCSSGTASDGCAVTFENTGPTEATLLLERNYFANNRSNHDTTYAVVVRAAGDGDVRATLRNATIRRNYAFAPGLVGAVLVEDTSPSAAGKAFADLNNMTIEENQHIGVHASSSTPGDARIDVSNSVLADNDGYDCEGAVYSRGHNLLGDNVPPAILPGRICDFSTGLGDLVTADAHLFGPSDEGGYTPVMRTENVSPGHDAGSPLRPGSGGGACEATDQRGAHRYRCDIGSYDGGTTEYCADTALPSCRPLSDASFQMRDRDADGPGDGDRIRWKWREPLQTVVTDYGDPTSTTMYTVCVYDTAGEQLVARLSDDGVHACNSPAGACWTEQSNGFRYRDKDAFREGLRSISLTATDEPGKAKGSFKAEGARMNFLSILPLVGDVRVQLQKYSGGVCWESVHPAGAARPNSTTEFQSKTP